MYLHSNRQRAVSVSWAPEPGAQPQIFDGPSSRKGARLGRPPANPAGAVLGGVRPAAWGGDLMHEKGV